MKKTKELEALYSGEVTKENCKWYTHIELLPRLHKMRKENKLLHDQNKKINGKSYFGDTDLDGNACGWG